MKNGRNPLQTLMAVILLGCCSVFAGGPGSPGEERGLPDGFVVDATFSSHLPLLVLKRIPAGEGAPGRVEMRLIAGGGGANRPGDGPAARELALFEEDSAVGGKVAGTFRLIAENGHESPRSLLGMPEAAAWTIVGDTLDKAMLRNTLARRLAARIYAGNAPEARVCELLSEEEGGRYRYQGLHLLSEHVVDGVWMSPRALADKRALARAVGGAQGRGGARPDFVEVYGGQDTKGDFSERLRRITGSLESATPSTYLQYMSGLDVDASIDAYILCLAFMNDPVSPPFYWFRSRRLGRIGLVPRWDFTNSLDNFREAVDGRVSLMDRYPWLDDLLRSSDFIDRLKARYFQLRRGSLAPARLDAMVDGLVAELGPALGRDWRRWEAVYVPADSERIVSAEQEVLKIRHYLRMQGETVRFSLLRLHLREGLVNTNLNTRLNSALAVALIMLFLLLASYCRNRF